MRSGAKCCWRMEEEWEEEEVDDAKINILSNILKEVDISRRQEEKSSK